MAHWLTSRNQFKKKTYLQSLRAQAWGLLQYEPPKAKLNYCNKQAIKQGQILAKKISEIKRRFDLTFTDVHTDLQKLGTILENKVVQN